MVECVLIAHRGRSRGNGSLDSAVILCVPNKMDGEFPGQPEESSSSASISPKQQAQNFLEEMKKSRRYLPRKPKPRATSLQIQ